VFGKYYTNIKKITPIEEKEPNDYCEKCWKKYSRNCDINPRENIPYLIKEFDDYYKVIGRLWPTMGYQNAPYEDDHDDDNSPFQQLDYDAYHNLNKT
jgi:hypothetical protein